MGRSRTYSAGSSTMGTLNLEVKKLARADSDIRRDSWLPLDCLSNSFDSFGLPFLANLVKTCSQWAISLSTSSSWTSLR